MMKMEIERQENRVRIYNEQGLSVEKTETSDNGAVLEVEVQELGM